MSVYIDKTIHAVKEENKILHLGTISEQRRKPGGRPGGNSLLIELVEKVDYRLHADKMPFLFLGIPPEDPEEDGEESNTLQKKEFHLSWDTECTPKQFYIPSSIFHETVYAALGEKEKGSVCVQEWGKDFLKRDYSLQEYLQVQQGMQIFLDQGFIQQQGLVSIRTNHYALLLGHYPKRKRVTVFLSKDLSDALGPLVRATSRLPFTESDDKRLTAAITYFLNETIFEETHH